MAESGASRPVSNRLGVFRVAISGVLVHDDFKWLLGSDRKLDLLCIT